MGSLKEKIARISTNQTIRVSVSRKCKSSKPYEMEQFDISSEVELSERLSGKEFAYACASMQGELEAVLYTGLLKRGLVTQEEFDERMREAKETIAAFEPRDDE